MMGRFFTKNDPEKVLSVYFHNPDPRLFEKLIRWISGNGYEFISASQLEQLINERKQLKHKALITFDDGNKEYLSLLPIIEKYKVPVTMFIPTDPVENGNYWWDFAGIKEQQQFTGLDSIEAFKKLPVEDFDLKLDILKENFKPARTCITLDELKVLSASPFVTIGAHTVSHPILKNCSEQRQITELKSSRKTLDVWLRQQTVYLAYPNGDYDQRTLHIAREEGYRLGFTTRADRIDPVNDGRLELPRYSVNDDGGYYENLAKINGLWQKF